MRSGCARGRYRFLEQQPYGLIQTARCAQEHAHSIYDPAIARVTRSLTPSDYSPRASVPSHNDLINEVVRRIEKSGDYCFIMKNQKYFGYCDERQEDGKRMRIPNGELDVFGIGYEGAVPFFTYFEIKTAHSKKAIVEAGRKAKEQFEQWKGYMQVMHHVPEESLDTVLITPVTIDLELPWH